MQSQPWSSQPSSWLTATAMFELVKRFIDIVAATLGLVVLSPFFLLIAIVVRSTSEGPALFRQTRVGRNGALFTMVKFRTMVHGNDDSVHREYAQRHAEGVSELRANGDGEPVYLLSDSRITSVGEFLRRSSLDELPNLLNVLGGAMSLVGPRPPIPYEVENYNAAAMRRLEVKPGMTGWAQIEGRGGLTFREMIELDVQYVDTRSIRTDVRILLRTIPAVLRRRGV